MTNTTKIPCTIMRAGTSKGTYFLADDLPKDPTKRNELLLQVMGSYEKPNFGQIDGIGGGTFVTSKVAVISPSSQPGVDVNYKFIQIIPDGPTVDDKPTCGNVLTGVGAFAIETGLVNAKEDSTEVTVFDENTKSLITQCVQTPKGKVNYQGSFKITGSPGSAAPIEMFFKNITGGKTGHFMPTGNAIDVFDGVETTCLDISMPTVFMEAKHFSISGYESAEELSANKALLEKMLAIREQASHKMGMGSAKGNVIPKMALLSPPASKEHLGNLCVRYFTPGSCHPSVAVSAGFNMATACFISGTLPHRLVTGLNHSETVQQLEKEKTVSVPQHTVKIENPSGTTGITVDFSSNSIALVTGKATRSAKLLFSGHAYAST